MAEKHTCFTVGTTAYLRAMPRAEMKNAVAVHYQAPPRNTAGGMSISLRFPILLVPGLVEDGEKMAEKVAAILNLHWTDED